MNAAAPAEPVAEILSAWVAGVEAGDGGLRVRVGEAVTLRIRAVNRGGPARRGTIRVELLENPRLRLGFESSLERTLHRRSGAGTVIEAIADDWPTNAEGWLLVRLVPGDVGEIVLAYRAVLEGRFGRASTYPPAEPGKVVRIRVTHTLAGGNEQ